MKSNIQLTNSGLARTVLRENLLSGDYQVSCKYHRVSRFDMYVGIAWICSIH